MIVFTSSYIHIHDLHSDLYAESCIYFVQVMVQHEHYSHKHEQNHVHCFDFFQFLLLVLCSDS